MVIIISQDSDVTIWCCCCYCCCCCCCQQRLFMRSSSAFSAIAATSFLLAISFSNSSGLSPSLWYMARTRLNLNSIRSMVGQRMRNSGKTHSFISCVNAFWLVDWTSVQKKTGLTYKLNVHSDFYKANKQTWPIVDVWGITFNSYKCRRAFKCRLNKLYWVLSKITEKYKVELRLGI